MTQTFVIHCAREALFTILLLAGPAMVMALLVGLLISILQATTQIQDQMLNMVPKILVMFITILVLGSWMLATAIRFTTNLYAQIPTLLR